MHAPFATDNLLRHKTSLLAELAARHGITRVQLGERDGELIVVVSPGTTYLDLAAFELEFEAQTGHELVTTGAGAPGANSREVLVPTIPAV